MFKPVVLVATLSCLLGACSGLKTYRSDHQKNLFITTQTEARGWFSGVDASLDIYRMQSECDVDYQGTVNLGDSRVEVGVPADVPAYLVFRFESSAFLSNTNSSMGYDVALYPMAGQVYDVNVTYRDNIYNVEVQERVPGVSEPQAMVLSEQDSNCDARSL